jgi:hypothetical protein
MIEEVYVLMKDSAFLRLIPPGRRGEEEEIAGSYKARWTL